MMIEIRTEQLGDEDAIHRVLCEAFPTEMEAKLVRALREQSLLTVSLVAVVGEVIVGHVAFSEVTVKGRGPEGLPPRGRGVGLAPVAVLPELHGQGIGSALVLQGITRCIARGDAFIVVLGEPAFYTRFGFTTASKHGLQNVYDVDESFMARALKDDALTGVTGTVHFSSAFDGL